MRAFPTLADIFEHDKILADLPFITPEQQAQRDANWLAARDTLLPLLQKAHDCGFYVDTVAPILKGQK